MAVYQVAHLQLTHRYRRQASSHIFCPVFQSKHRTTCGSGLARDGGVSGGTFAADSPLSQASQLPHFFALCSSPNTANPVGAGLARDGGVSVGTFAADPPLSQASQLPHFLPCAPVQTPPNLWEQGLHAMAVYPLAHLQLTHHYRRQASSHIFCPVLQSKHRQTCGSRACPRWRCIRWHICS